MRLRTDRSRPDFSKAIVMVASIPLGLDKLRTEIHRRGGESYCNINLLIIILSVTRYQGMLCSLSPSWHGCSFSTEGNWMLSLHSPVDPGLCTGEMHSIPGPGGVFMAGDPEINP